MGNNFLIMTNKWYDILIHRLARTPINIPQFEGKKAENRKSIYVSSLLFSPKYASGIHINHLRHCYTSSSLFYRIFF